MTITDALRFEHTAYRKLWGVIEELLPQTRTAEGVHLLATIVAKLLREHGQEEDNLLYAAFNHLQLDQGRLHRLIDEHAELDGALEDIIATDDLAEARKRLTRVLAKVSNHFEFEEGVFFPAIDAVVSVQALTELEQQRSAAAL